MRAGTLLLALAMSGAFAGAARGADADWLLCGAGLQVPARPASAALEPGADPQAIYLSADDGDFIENGVSVLTGNVEVEQGVRQIRSDELVYNRPEETLNARGNVRFWNKGVFAAGDEARAHTGKDVITIEPGASFILEDRHGHGDGAGVAIFGRERLTAHDATYTTCNPGAADWRVTAGRVEFDRVEGVGDAWNAWLEFKGLPVFYTPWISFPLGDRRKSGLLAPSYGVSGSSGVEITAPYYFNLAPNYDATLAMRVMSARGVQGQGELRFLSRTYGAGQVAAHYLPFDAKFDGARAAVELEHQRRWSSRWSTHARFEWVSDAEYFGDLGTTLSQSSRTHLPRRIDANYRADGWSARIRLEDFLTVDRTIQPQSRPYARLPQILVHTRRPERNRALNFNAAGQLTYFDQRSRTTGARVDLQPSVTYPIRTAGAFVIPKATLRFTRYALDQTGAEASGDSAPSRLLPGFSLDGGVFLDRPFALRGRSLTHTIEPRLYYLLVPFDRQDALPNFDSGRFSFNFAQLFREDRFSGGDRVGDANQLTLALTSRLLDEGGGELARASIGQIRYFRDRKVVLDATHDPDTAQNSDIITQIEARPAREWRIRADLQYDTGADRIDKNTLSVRFQPDERRVVNATYRFVRGAGQQIAAVDQTDLSFAWPLGAHWRAVGRWNLAINRNRSKTLEVFGGLEYENCCWGFRAVARRFLTSGGQYLSGVFLQLELKGLTGVGHDTETFLEHNIPGYENEL